MMFKTASLAALAFALAGGAVPALSATGQAQRKAEPATIQVAAGNVEVLTAQARGVVVYECRREKAPLATYKWLMSSTQAVLTDEGGKEIGLYSALPARWSHIDGSFVAGSQVAVSPHGEKNLPFQLVKADVAGGQGVLTTVSYVQRLATEGGAPPRSGCAENKEAERVEVGFTASYRFWKAS